MLSGRVSRDEDVGEQVHKSMCVADSQSTTMSDCNGSGLMRAY